MPEAKKRTFVDGTFVNLFREVDPEKKKVFDMWYYKLKSKFRFAIAKTAISDAKDWFGIVIESGVWLADDHVDLAMELLCDRARRYRNRSVSPSESSCDAASKMLSTSSMLRQQPCLVHVSRLYVGICSRGRAGVWPVVDGLYIPLCSGDHELTHYYY